MTAAVLIDEAAHHDAANWYRLGRAEPVGGGDTIAIGDIYSLRSYSLDAMLDRIIESVQPGRNLIIVGHGRELGLSARLFAGSQSRFRYEIASSLATDRARESGGLRLPAISPERVAELAQISVEQVNALRAKMNLVRAKNINHVAFRACLMGAWPDTLNGYLEFFGCAAVSALDLRDTYGNFSLPRAESNFDAWLRSHSDSGRNPWHTYVYGEGINRVGIATRGGADSDEHSYTTAVAAASEAGFRDWRRVQVTEGGFGTVYYHGCFRRTPMAGTKRIIFVGDSEYETHIVTRRRGQRSDILP
jgi:hypothetical protein